MIGYDKAITVYHKTLTSETVQWTPTTVHGVYAEVVNAINPSSTTTANAPAMLIDVPIAAYSQIGGISAGDYIVVGEGNIGAFTGSAAAKLVPLGGRLVESTAEYVYGFAVDHVEVTAR